MLSFRPKLEDVGKTLECRASNPAMDEEDGTAAEPIADSIQLKIDCEWRGLNLVV